MPVTPKKLKFSGHLKDIRASLSRHAEQATTLALEISDLAEPPMKEFESSRKLAAFLKERGFKVSWPWKHLPTAFKAVLGIGRPQIALLAEYDALPDCGARAGLWGHGCGHNLLGAGTALAAAVAGEALSRMGAKGQVIVFGTPAEELLSGKVKMAAAGAFKGLDAVLAWHPGGNTWAGIGGGLAMDSISFSFRGQTAHAGGAPHKGRSALDAAILTDVAVNFLREHIQEQSRIHCVIPNGGKAPNVVPDRAEIWYYIRGTTRKHVDELRGKVIRCAQGAAMATETRCSLDVYDSVAERIPNRVLAEMLDAIMHRCGAPKFTPADARAAARIVPGKKFAAGIDPINTAQARASSDEDNVSWFAPLGRLSVACVPRDTTGHHRQFAAASRAAGAMRGMVKAAEYLAAGTVELVLSAELLKASQQEFRKNMNGKKYKLPKPSGVNPSLRPKPVD